MSIKILPARLANQIAAGEVVERPASVLKELLENSIDAGATAIEVDIEKGGHKKIKLTDNGEGISKDELTLALSRHATSKIHDLDDLERIVTLGFRGEALASISSVSRLTLTSKTEKQSEAWQARCEGRDMQVLVEPAAHPQGTSVEVLDLFFNTPARRKFLRTEKTEFNHIEELFRRFALSQFGVSLKLKHNGKLVKSLPAISGREQYLKRIRQICGPAATEGLVELNSEYQQFRLWGWISGPGQFQAMNDNQFVFVNNRMMKDKLINHAIRQAYEGLLPEDKFPYFVLYLDIPTDEVDVNVHPAKHEVRFHQSRLIHDFIFSAINDALGQSFEAATSHGDEQHNRGGLNENVTHQYTSGTVAQNVQSEAETMGYIAPLQAEVNIRSEGPTYQGGGNPQGGSYRGASSQVKSGHFQATERNFKSATENYQTLVTAPAEETLHQQQMTVAGIGLILNGSGEYWLIPRSTLLELMLSKQLQTDKPVTQPLLLPVSVHCEVHKPDKALLESCQTLGLDMQLHGCKLMLKGVPVGTRQQCWQDILLALSSSTDGSEMLPEPEQKPEPEKTPEPEQISGETTRSYIIKVLARHWRLNHEENLMPLWQSVSRQHNSDDLLTKIARKIPIAAWLESEL